MALGLRMRPHPTNLVLVMPANFEDMKWDRCFISEVPVVMLLANGLFYVAS
jgi:hypothetical protein